MNASGEENGSGLRRPGERGGAFIMAGYEPVFRMTDEVSNLTIEIGELMGIVSVDPRFAPDPKLRRENRIRTIYSTLAIEQNRLSLEQVSALMYGCG